MKYTVLTQLPEGNFIYNIAKKGKKYSLLDKQIVENFSKIPKKSYIGIWQDAIEILKVETPKTKNKNIIESFIKKHLLETLTDIRGLIINYQLSFEGNLNKTFNVYTISESTIYEIIPDKKDHYKIETITLIPFSLVFYNIDKNFSSVIHFYIKGSTFIAVFTIGKAVEFVRITEIPSQSRNIAVLENIILTLRYVSSNIQIPEIILLSGESEIFNEIALDLQGTINTPFCELNYGFYFNDNFQELIIPVGIINILKNYNFISEKIKYEKLSKSIYTWSSTVLAGINIFLFFTIFSNASEVLDKYYSIKDIHRQNQTLKTNIEESLKGKDLKYLLTIHNLIQEKNNSIKGLNNILNLQQYFDKHYNKFSYKYNQNKFEINFSYTKTFKTLKDMESYAEKLKNDKIKLEIDYSKKTVEVFVKYGN